MGYNSKYTGTEVDAALDLANTALQEHQDISGKQDVISDLAAIRSGATLGTTSVQPNDLSDVATSGSYNDLSDKPTIPSAVTESTVSGWGFTKNTGTYSKPSTGIPKSDLASAVQTSLGKADTALQSYTEQYKGTVTGVKMNGTTKNPSNGVVDLGTVITAHQDLSGYQPKLVSGTNIKTINGTSILGIGDIVIEGGSGGASSGGSGAYELVNHWTSDTIFTLTPNTFHVWDEVTSLELYLGSEVSGVANEYLFQFTSGATATTLTLPSNIAWIDGAPTIEPYKQYQCSIVNGLGIIVGESPIFIMTLGNDYDSEEFTFYLPYGTTGNDLLKEGFQLIDDNEIGYSYFDLHHIEPAIYKDTVISGDIYYNMITGYDSGGPV